MLKGKKKENRVVASFNKTLRITFGASYSNSRPRDESGKKNKMEKNEHPKGGKNETIFLVAAIETTLWGKKREDQ